MNKLIKNINCSSVFKYRLLINQNLPIDATILWVNLYKLVFQESAVVFGLVSM